MRREEPTEVTPTLLGRAASDSDPPHRHSASRTLGPTPARGFPIPDAVPLRHDLVPLLEGPVSPALGHICLLEGFLQLLAQSLALLSKEFSLLVGSPGIHCHRVFDLVGSRGKQRDGY